TFRRGPTQGTAEPTRGVERGEHADVVATTDELLGKRLDVPVHTSLVRPGIWRDEPYAHRRQRVDDRPVSVREAGRRACRRIGFSTSISYSSFGAGLHRPSRLGPGVG